jgi:hypothetical protein
MKLGDVVARLDVPNRRFSTVLVKPKSSLLAMAAPIWERKGLGVYRNYCPEDDIVAIVPPVECFSKTGSFQRLLEAMKPAFLKSELIRFNMTAEEFGRPLTAQTFDEFFDLERRTSTAVMLMEDFGLPSDLEL